MPPKIDFTKIKSFLSPSIYALVGFGRLLKLWEIELKNPCRGGKPVTSGVSLPGSAVAGIALAGEGLVFVQAPHCPQ